MEISGLNYYGQKYDTYTYGYYGSYNSLYTYSYYNTYQTLYTYGYYGSYNVAHSYTTYYTYNVPHGYYYNYFQGCYEAIYAYYKAPGNVGDIKIPFYDGGSYLYVYVAYRVSSSKTAFGILVNMNRGWVGDLYYVHYNDFYIHPIGYVYRQLKYYYGTVKAFSDSDMSKTMRYLYLNITAPSNSNIRFYYGSSEGDFWASTLFDVYNGIETGGALMCVQTVIIPRYSVLSYKALTGYTYYNTTYTYSHLYNYTTTYSYYLNGSITRYYTYYQSGSYLTSYAYYLSGSYTTLYNYIYTGYRYSQIYA